MRSSRYLRAALTATALAAAAASSHAAVESFTSGAAFFKRVITNTSVATISTSAPSALTFADVPNTLTTIFVPPQTAVLVSVNFDAEARCNGGNKASASVSGDPNWCELMVMIGGVEGSPQASTTSLGDTYSFAATDSGEATFASWRGHAMSRHRCVRNASNAPLPVAVSVQWKIVNFSPATAPATEFWLDDSAMVIQMSRDCVVQAVPTAASNGPETTGKTQSVR
jgi:hypothetical protein